MKKCNHKWKWVRNDITNNYIVALCKKCKGVDVRLLPATKFIVPKLSTEQLEKCIKQLKEHGKISALSTNEIE